jgi:hypothetical protein
VDDQDDVRRLNYFTNQFLRAADFQAEQDYHVQQRRRHNQMLHTWGIATGLGVEPKLNAQAVTVNAGTAIDGDGREIVLIKPQDIDLPAPPDAVKLFVTIAYAEEPANQSTDAGITGHTRWLEKPVIAASPSPPAGTGQQIVLAVVERGEGETAIRVDRSTRRFAGPSASSMSLAELELRSDEQPTWDWVRMAVEADGRAALTGSLHVSGDVLTEGNHVARGSLTVEQKLSAPSGSITDLQAGTLSVGQLVVKSPMTFGALTATGDLQVQGSAAVSGSLTAKAPATFAGGVQINPVSGKNALVVSGAASLTAGLSVSGATTFANGLTVSAGTTALGGALTVSGLVTLSNGLTVTGAANVSKALTVGAGFQALGGAITPAAGNAETAGIQFPPDPGGGTLDRAFIRYFVESGETTKLLIGIGGDPDDRLSLSQNGAERLTISSGNVGIGTQTAMRPLHVESGEVHSRGGYSFSSRPVRIGGGGVGGPFGVIIPGGTVIGPVGDFVEDSGDSGARWLLTANAGTMALSTGTRNVLTSTPLGGVTIPGTLTVSGALSANGGKVAYVVDRFVNNLGDPLDQGDVVVVHDNGTSVSYGDEGQIPIPEVDLTDTAYDTRVCGIVEAVHGEMAKPGPDPETGKKPRARAPLVPRIFDIDERANLDHTTVQPGQVGAFVTLGAYAHCKVDADIAPIVAGDLLTTSPTRGHAQKVLDPALATGAVIGKALAGRGKGKGKIPVLVTLG